jgi:hypothetical protein
MVVVSLRKQRVARPEAGAGLRPPAPRVSPRRASPSVPRPSAPPGSRSAASGEQVCDRARQAPVQSPARVQRSPASGVRGSRGRCPRPPRPQMSPSRLAARLLIATSSSPTGGRRPSSGWQAARKRHGRKTAAMTVQLRKIMRASSRALPAQSHIPMRPRASERHRMRPVHRRDIGQHLLGSTTSAAPSARASWPGPSRQGSGSSGTGRPRTKASAICTGSSPWRRATA